MPAEVYANDALTTLALPCGAADASVTVLTAAAFPAAGNFRLRIDDELLLATAVAGNVFTVTRAVEVVAGVQAAAAHAAGATVEHVLTAASLLLLPPGPGGGTSAPGYSAANKDAVTFAPGAPLAVHPSGVGVINAAAADNLRNAAGLATLGAAPLAAETVRTSGPLTLADWTAVAGSVALAAGATYYLSATAGGLTTTPPSAAGRVVQAVGRAVAPDTLEILLGPSMIL